MNIIRIPILQTNYVWLIYNHKNECIVIDPGETIQILKIIKQFNFILKAILLTHYHDDHINGVSTLIKYYPKTIIYGPVDIKTQRTNVLIISEGDDFTLLQKKFTVFHLPGHTSNHIGFYSIPWLFCGDTVFSAGCGKFNKKSAQQMYTSFIKISKLPHNTLIFSGHEYTLSNINFATTILPKDKFITDYYKYIIKLRKNNYSTIPTTLNLELKINIFFRCNNLNIKKSLNFFPNFGETWKIFFKLRQKKDFFNLNYTDI